MNISLLPKILILCLLLFYSPRTKAQNIQQKKMNHLRFMVGNWVGTSTQIKDGKVVRAIQAFQQIAYKVDQHLITIDLNSESLSLHTVIYYDTEKETYIYTAFYKEGSARYTAAFKSGQLVVQASKGKRFIFSEMPDGGFREHGEVLKNGQWETYFEDNFKNED